VRVYERAYAKINLYLDVTGRDGDGYHTLRSVMQTVGLYDGITVDAVAAAAPSVSLSVRGRYRVPIGEGNLAHRAAMTYMEAAAVPMRVHIYMEKHIPVAAGLGGGSADAAAVLRAMNRIAGNRLTGARLLTLAATLGSDVPFCLLGHTRLCEGRGERMRALPPVPQIPLVILPSTERVSTPAAYAALDAAYGNFETVGEHGDLDAMLSALGRGTSAVAPALYNIFEDAVLPTCPIAAANRRALLTHGAAAAMMSGSGPTVFGLFTDEGDARCAAAALGNAAVATHTV
jgi:4-diphosphocytidyl-2-C-methyl-D-erythritol kinase